MGIALRRPAYSPNIKERMDASCALFDGEGRMLAQAEHIPVHLGSMPVTIEVLREEMSDLADEGLVIPPTKFLRRGEEVRAVVQEIIREMRNPRERLGDLRAQVAANELGASRFLSLLSKYGATRIDTFAAEILAYSERRVRAAIAAMPRGTWRARDVLQDPRDDGFLPIAAEVTVGGSGILVDFEGTSRQIEGNLNAPLSVTLSAMYYVFRCLTDPEAPANSGCYAPIAVHAPHGSLVNPRPPAPVAAG